MEDLKEKLVELLDNFNVVDDWYTNGEIADILIAYGVTFAKDNNVPSKWISVKDRLPEKEMEVIVYTGNILKPSVFCYHFWTADLLSWQSVTHWMPLPPAPKGE